jgi:esterase
MGPKTIVPLHGGGLTAHTWDLISATLQAEYRCLAIDLRGHGNSELSPNLAYTPDDYNADLEELVEIWGLDRYPLIGRSLGGLTSIRHAGHNSDRLACLELVDVGPRTSGTGTERTATHDAARRARVDRPVHRDGAGL